jgi:hypothetical protein
MALIKINDNPSDRDLRQFAGIWFPLFWVAVAGIVFYSTGRVAIPLALLAAGLVVGAIGAVYPPFIRPVFLIWMYGAFPIGFVVSHLLLGIVYYGLMTPVGLAMRLAGHDSMQRRFDRDAPTYWTPMDRVSSKSEYLRQL